MQRILLYVGLLLLTQCSALKFGKSMALRTQRALKPLQEVPRVAMCQVPEDAEEKKIEPKYIASAG